LAVLGFTWSRGYPVLEYVRQVDGPIAKPPTLAAAYKAWKDEKPGQKPTLVLVAAAGGGIRASFWTSLIMTRLADDVDDFRDKLFASSGVSGGSLGLAVSYGLLAAKDLSCVQDSKSEPCARKFYEYDFLAGIVGATFAGVPANALIPVFAGRNNALEASWENRWKATVGANTNVSDGFALPLSKLWGEAAVHPLLLLNATSATSGDRAISADVDTDWMKLRTSCRINLTQEINLPLSASIGASARFPFVSDWGWLKISQSKACGQLEAVADGGFYDNYGAATVRDLLDGLSKAGVNLSNDVHLVVIQITSDPLREMGCLSKILNEDKKEPNGVEDFCAIKQTKPTVWSGIFDSAVGYFQVEPSSGLVLAKPSESVQHFLGNITSLMRNAFLGGGGPGVLDVTLQARAATGIDSAERLREQTCGLKGSYYHLGMTGAEAIPLGWALSQSAQERLTARLNEGYVRDRLDRLVRELTTGEKLSQCAVN
jgi:hypothetical protein